MTPDEAIAEYNAVEYEATRKYRQYWIDKFNAAGVPFVPKETRWNGSFECLNHNGYDITAHVAPSHFEGVKLEIRMPLPTPIPPGYHWRSWVDVKVKAESGFKKFIRRLTYKDFNPI